MGGVQKALSIGDEAPHMNKAITEFVKKIGDIAF